MNASGDREAARASVRGLRERCTALVARIERDADDRARLWKPAEDSWSLTEVVQHLSLVADATLRTARPATGTRFPRGLKSALLARVLASRLRIRVSIAAITPRSGIAWSDARANLGWSAGRWEAFVDSNEFDDTQFRHPFVGALSAAQTARFVFDHFDHHAMQIDRLFALLGTR